LREYNKRKSDQRKGDESEWNEEDEGSPATSQRPRVIKEEVIHQVLSFDFRQRIVWDETNDSDTPRVLNF
jgi:hypothetical protein